MSNETFTGLLGYAKIKVNDNTIRVFCSKESGHKSYVNEEKIDNLEQKINNFFTKNSGNVDLLDYYDYYQKNEDQPDLNNFYVHTPDTVFIKNLFGSNSLYILDVEKLKQELGYTMENLADHLEIYPGELIYELEELNRKNNDFLEIDYVKKFKHLFGEKSKMLNWREWDVDYIYNVDVIMSLIVGDESSVSRNMIFKFLRNISDIYNLDATRTTLRGYEIINLAKKNSMFFKPKEYSKEQLNKKYFIFNSSFLYYVSKLFPGSTSFGVGDNMSFFGSLTCNENYLRDDFKDFLISKNLEMKSKNKKLLFLLNKNLKETGVIRTIIIFPPPNIIVKKISTDIGREEFLSLLSNEEIGCVVCVLDPYSYLNMVVNNDVFKFEEIEFQDSKNVPIYLEYGLPLRSCTSVQD